MTRWTSSISMFSILLVPAAFLVGMAVGILNPLYVLLAAGAFVGSVVYLIRLDEFIAMLVVLAHILIDSYLNYAIYQGALLMALTLLLVCYLGRSKKRPWTEPRFLGLWILFLVLTIVPMLEGGVFSLSNSFGYYLEVMFSAFILFWLGNVIAKDIGSVRRIFQLLSFMAALFAIHTIIQATTGVFLFETAQAKAELAQFTTYFQLGGNTSRASSFFGNPNGNGIFLVVCVFLPLGLFFESDQFWHKALYLVETILVFIALAFTYSTGSWAAAFAGLALFIAFSGRKEYSIAIVIAVIAAGIGVVLAFPDQIAVQLAHSSDQGDTSLHFATWFTAINVALAYPLFGVGLGSDAYYVLAEPYRVPAQTKPLAEPDNSFFQMGAIAGLPAMIVFLAILGAIFWMGWRNWRSVDVRYRVLFAGGAASVLALSVNSMSVDGWTSPIDIQFLGWLIAGVVASPLVAQYMFKEVKKPAKKSAGTDTRVGLAYPE